MKKIVSLSAKPLISETSPVEEKKSGRTNKWWPFLLEIILYYFFWAIFSFILATGFIWSNVFAFILTVIVINLFRLFKPRQLETAVTLLLFIFVAMIAIEVVQKNNSVASSVAAATLNNQSHGSETIYLPGKTEGRRMSQITFPVSQEFRVTVSGAPVMFFGYYPKERYKMTQKHGTYAYISTRCDHLDFRSLTNRSSVVTIDW
jgi:hypothetical protein